MHNSVIKRASFGSFHVQHIISPLIHHTLIELYDNWSNQTLLSNVASNTSVISHEKSDRAYNWSLHVNQSMIDLNTNLKLNSVDNLTAKLQIKNLHMVVLCLIYLLSVIDIGIQSSILQICGQHCVINYCPHVTNCTLLTVLTNSV